MRKPRGDPQPREGRRGLRTSRRLAHLLSSGAAGALSSIQASSRGVPATMSRRAVNSLSLVLVLSVAAASAAACGSDNPAEPQQAAQQPAAQPAAKAAPWPSAGETAQPPAAAAPKPGGLQPSRAQADAMSVSELVRRRDLWPQRVAFTKEARLD